MDESPISVIPTPIEGFLVEEIDGEAVLFHPGKNIIVQTNQIALLIWNLCDGERSEGEIIDLLSAAFPEDAENIPCDVDEMLKQLAKSRALVLEGSDFVVKPDG